MQKKKPHLKGTTNQNQDIRLVRVTALVGLISISFEAMNNIADFIEKLIKYL